MDFKTKILICGDVEGKFDTLFAKVESINKKSGPFELLLCVGNFFGVNNKEFDQYKTGSKKIPISTYILGSNKEEHESLYPDEESSELCDNVFYLGKKGIFMSSGGLKLAYLSGIAAESNPKSYNYNAEDAMGLRDMCLKADKNFKGVDILLTSQWPEGVTNGIPKTDIKIETQFSTYLSSWLALQLMPRYHVAGLEGIFYERPPYRNHNTDDLDVTTRFIGLARVGNVKKDKWIYALNLCPLNKMKISELLQKTTDETLCPYNLPELEARVLKKKKRVDQSSQQYFFDMSERKDENKGRNKQKKQKVTFDQNKCWFCLASPAVEKHLVVTVGTTVYLAIPKGGLVPEHILICPVEHYQSSVNLQSEILEEIGTYKLALRKFYEKTEKFPVFFERNFKTSHMQVHAIPIPKSAVKNIKDIFMEQAETNAVELQELDKNNRLDQVIPTGCPFFTVELPDGELLYVKIKASGFPINFPRQVLATSDVLNVPERIEWQNCALSREQEDNLVQKLRKTFAPFDPS